MSEAEQGAGWEAGWELEFPATSVDELLLALVVRDLVHGASYDVEAEETGQQYEVDYEAGEELEGEVYRLLIAASVKGPEDHDAMAAFTEQMLDEVVAEAEELVAEKVEVGSLPEREVVFQKVSEDGERWDLVMPEWLAPQGAEVPFGFRGFHAGGAGPWPSDADLDAHGRVVMVPFGARLTLFGIPKPADACD
jgi:hypothetical protein